MESPFNGQFKAFAWNWGRLPAVRKGRLSSSNHDSNDHLERRLKTCAFRVCDAQRLQRRWRPVQVHKKEKRAAVIDCQTTICDVAYVDASGDGNQEVTRHQTLHDDYFVEMNEAHTNVLPKCSLVA